MIYGLCQGVFSGCGEIEEARAETAMGLTVDHLAARHRPASSRQVQT